MYSRSGFGDLVPSLSFQKMSGATLYPDFKVGDSWMATITGPANSPVWLQSSRSGSPMILTQLGVTDSTGKFSLSGTVGTGDIGSWVETWYVGGLNTTGAAVTNGQSLGTISFTVSAPTSAPVQNPVTPPVPGLFPAMPYVPTWAWYAAAGLAIFSLFGGHRR